MASYNRNLFCNWDNGEVYNKDDVTQFLISSDPEDRQRLNTIIRQAVVDDEEETLHYLFSKGYKIDKIDSSGGTFLHQAFYGIRGRILSSGIKFWVPHITEEAVKLVDTNGLTILHVACYSTSSDELVKKCLDCNADVNARFWRDPENRKWDGFTPLHFATVNFEGLNWMELLIDHKANVNARDSRGRTPLHIASRVSEDPDEREMPDAFVDVIEFLLDNDADINAKDDEGNTPLLSVFTGPYYSIDSSMLKLKLLVKRGADVTLRNGQGETILHLIIKNLGYLRAQNTLESSDIFNDSNHLQMVQLILDTRPDFNVNEKNILGESPLQLAMSYLSVDIVRVLLNRNADYFVGYLDFQKNGISKNFIIIPQMEEVVNFLGINEEIANKGIEIDPEENLQILAYLTHEYCDGSCDYLYQIHDHYRSTNLLGSINFGSSSHFQSLCKKITAKLSVWRLMFLGIDILSLLTKNLKIRKHANFYADSSMLPQNFTSTKQLDNIPLPQDVLAKLESELDCMKSTKLSGSVTLFDVMSKHPHSIYQYLADVNLSKVVQDYSVCKDIIKGHLTKSLVRHYVEKSGFDYLKDLLPPSCPSLCCKRIMDYLSNRDILTVVQSGY